MFRDLERMEIREITQHLDLLLIPMMYNVMVVAEVDGMVQVAVDKVADQVVVKELNLVGPGLVMQQLNLLFLILQHILMQVTQGVHIQPAAVDLLLVAVVELSLLV